MMNTRPLSIFGIILALGCWLGLVLLRVFVFQLSMHPIAVLVEIILVLVGSIIFWRWISLTLQRQQREVQQRTKHLEALHAASMGLTTEHDLTNVLQKVVDLSRSLLNAKYGALGILDEDGQYIDQMITSGMTPAQRAQLDHFPTGHGLLGAPIHERHSVRVPEISADPRSRGFPPNHPAMHTFLGVPITSKGRIFGNLYLTDKLPGPYQSDTSSVAGGPLAFSQEDQEILEMFANQAAIAIENAKLYRQNEQIAILQERERFGMDLHDGVIQSIYAIGLMLDESRHHLQDDPEAVQTGMDAALNGLNQVIQDIRSYIHDLRAHQFESRDLKQGLEELVRELQTYSILGIEVDIASEALKMLSSHQTNNLLQIAREALSNVRKHAHATEVRISLQPNEHGITLQIQDNGIGLADDAALDSQGHGLRNMRERTSILAGELEVCGDADSGTNIRVSIPT